MTSVITTVRNGPIVTATLARPPVNAIGEALLDALDDLLDAITEDGGVAVLHLRSDQRAFCAGADLALMQSCFATPQGTDAMLELVRRMQNVFARLEAAPVVSIAEIGGAAIGGGLELALACDLRVAACEAKLGLSEARLGLLPAAGGTQRLTRLCGVGVAKRLILGGEIVDGTEALRLGLVQWARPRADVTAFAQALVQRVGGLPRAALAASKRCIAMAAAPQVDGFAEEIAATRDLYREADTQHRVAEFLAHTAP